MLANLLKSFQSVSTPDEAWAYLMDFFADLPYHFEKKIFFTSYFGTESFVILIMLLYYYREVLQYS